MPRKTKQQRADEALAARPFAHDSTDPYGAMPADRKAKVAESIAQAKASGASGDEMRAIFGPRLTGPARRIVLRTHGYGGTAYVARSYEAYRDGDERRGTRHAREHGSRAAELRAQAEADEAKRLADEAKRQARNAKAKARRDAKRAALATAPQDGTQDAAAGTDAS